MSGAGSGNGLNVLTDVNTNPIGLMLVGSNVSNNTFFGINVSGPNGTARVDDTTVTGNATGVAVSGGSILASFGTNRVFSNPHVGAANNGTFTPPTLTKN